MATPTLADWYSMSDGDWGDAIWSQNPSASPPWSVLPSHMLSGNINSSNKIVIRHYITNNDGIKINNNGSLTIRSGGTFDVSDLVINSGGTIQVNSGGTLVAESISNNGTLNNNGTVQSPDCDAITAGTGTCSNPLPIELKYFTANSVDGAVQISWETLTETNNDVFSVERSEDGFSYHVIGTVDGSGTVKEPRFYKFEDRSPIDGLSYYRLRQTDFDGAFELFGPVSVFFTGRGEGLEIWPNPVTDRYLEVSLNGLAPDEPVSLSLNDLSGRKVFDFTLAASRSGSFRQRVEIPSGLPRGIYILLLHHRGIEVADRVIIP